MSKDNTIVRRDEIIIKDFMKERDLPNWFRGLSHFQIQAGESLLNCIRDDSEQATTHRVRDALRRIGIEPLVGRSKIKLVMQLSRGNDIAFLWFLMELYYSSSCGQRDQKIYSVNEQIILTTIARLDTILTLRELEKLLPKQPERLKTKKNVEKKHIKPVIASPYFEKQRRPVLYGKSLIQNEVHNFANFSEFGEYVNPNYIVPNESNRWFANYELKKSERIAKGVLNDQIDSIIEHAQDKHKQSLTVCAHHQNVEAMKESMANELQVAKRKACEKFFDVNGHFKDQSYKRVMIQLNNQITKAVENFNKSANSGFKKRKSPEDNKQDASNKCHDENFNLYNLGHDAVITAKCNYFQAPTGKKPYKFNYNKIFDLGAKNPIKEAVASALNADSSGNISIEHGRAVRKCCKKIWIEEVKNHNIRNKNEQEADKNVTSESPLEFPDPPYDPRNKSLMASMLIKSLQEMKKNKKFVLASLPDAHKYPTLREWMKYRYGMAYTRQDKRNAFKNTKKVFQVLRKNALSVRIPHLDDLSRKRLVSYGCKDYLLKKTNYLKAIYYHNFKESLLEDTRIYWAAIRPYQCPKGPPRNEFFAYLPARKNDIQMFRPWKDREFTHAKEEWDKRQRNKIIECSH